MCISAHFVLYCSKLNSRTEMVPSSHLDKDVNGSDSFQIKKASLEWHQIPGEHVVQSQNLNRFIILKIISK